MAEAAETTRVVVGVEDAPAGFAALVFALSEAIRLGADLLVVHAWAPPPPDAAAAPDVAAAYAEAAERACAAAGRLVASAERVCAGLDGPPGREVTVVTPMGDPGPALIAAADHRGDLLVVGTERRGAFRRLPAGSISRHCVEHAGCPVVLVPAPSPAVPNVTLGPLPGGDAPGPTQAG